MKKIILFSSIACVLTACGDDGADTAPRIEPPAVSGKLTYTDESGKVVGELRGEQLAEVELIAADNQAVSGLSVRSIQPNNDFPDFALLNVSLLKPDTSKANTYNAWSFAQGVSKEISGNAFCLRSIEVCPSTLIVDPVTGAIEWKQNNAALAKAGNTPITIQLPPLNPTANLPIGAIEQTNAEKFYVSGSLKSQIPPTSLIFKTDRFPVQSINSSLNDSLLGMIQPSQITYQYEDFGVATSTSATSPATPKLRMRLAAGDTGLVLDVESRKIISYANTAKIPTLIELPIGGFGEPVLIDDGIALSDWNCLKNCEYALKVTDGQYRVTLNNAVFLHKRNSRQELTLTGAIDFVPHQAQLNLKKHSINTVLGIFTSVSNNTAHYTVHIPKPPETTTCNSGKEVTIARENQTIKSIEVACNHLDSVAKKLIKTVFGACGLPNTAACTGASLSADGHTFSFVKTKLSNNEELNGTLYFAGVAAADPAVTTP